MDHSIKSIVLAGAAPDTGNHGVTALCQSTVFGLSERGIDHFTILDNGTDTRTSDPLDWPIEAHISRLAFKAGKRVYQPANMHNIRLRQLFGLPSPTLSAIRAADAVLDVSGGDSFTDMYGSARFEQITIPKKIAISCGTPLILLPQTYGPFKSQKSRNTARSIINACTAAFARDSDSFARLKELMGADFNPAIHKQGIDLAFGLSMEAHIQPLSEQHIGINVSGLLWNNNCTRSQFALKADYQQTLLSFCQHILNNENLDILLVPHVTPANKYECDLFASQMLKKRLPRRYRHRIHIERIAKTPSHLKAVIANTCWFTGARMHATIAALSTGVPVANMAYSAKARGVFAGCGLGDCVLDMRHLTTANMITSLIRCYNERSHHKSILCSKLPYLKQTWANQLNAINKAISTSEKKQGCCYA